MASEYDQQKHTIILAQFGGDKNTRTYLDFETVGEALEGSPGGGGGWVETRARSVFSSLQKCANCTSSTSSRTSTKNRSLTT